MKKKSISNMAGNKKALDVKVKVAMGVGIALVAVGVGYLGYLAWYHAQTDVARPVDYDEFPIEESTEFTDDNPVANETYEQEDIPTTNAKFGDVLSYEIEDPVNTVTVTGVYEGTDYASVIGVNSNAVVVTYDVVIGEEDGWTSEPVMFTATMGDGSRRLLTYVDVDGSWVDPSIGSTTLEHGKTYQCIAYCEAPNYDGDVKLYSYASDMHCQELVVTR